MVVGIGLKNINVVVIVQTGQTWKKTAIYVRVPLQQACTAYGSQTKNNVNRKPMSKGSDNRKPETLLCRDLC